MLKRLRIKFILVAMLAIFLVLFAIIGGLNISNYVEINKKADDTLSFLIKNEGKIDRERRPGEGNIPPERFETRFFTVTFNESGEIVSTDLGMIAAIDAETAKEYATELYSTGSNSGYKGIYKYVNTTLKDGNTMYIFLDCARELDTFHDFLRSSIIISVIGFAVAGALVVIFSFIVMKPVAETYKKQKQFITDANHELKTPLTVIDASCEVLKISQGENEWTDTIKGQVKKLTELTNKLVFLSKMDEEERRVVKTEFSLSEIAAEAVKDYYVLAENSKKKFTVNIKNNVTILGDFSLIKQLITLLLDNAFKYSDEEGNIEFTLSESGKYKKIVVKNSTKGVPKGNLDMLFERFYRLDASRNSETGGSGIGLSVAKEIVNIHKGKINANSPDGKNIEFTVQL